MKQQLIKSLVSVAFSFLLSQDSYSQVYAQKTIYPNSIIICKDTTIYRKPYTYTYMHNGNTYTGEKNFNFVICKGIKVVFIDTVTLGLQDTFNLLENATLTLDSVRSKYSVGVLINAGPNAKTVVNDFTMYIEYNADSTATYSYHWPLPHRNITDWVPYSNGEYFDFTPIGGTNPCCNKISAIHEITSPSEKVRILPNPSIGQFKLNGVTSMGYEVNIEIIDALNRTIYQSKVSSNEVDINLGNVKPGAYSVILKGSNGVKALSLLVLQD